MKKLNRSSKKTRSSLRVEALEQRQLLAGISGGGTEVLTNLVHSNGNVYDQVQMNGSAVTVTADAGQITRVSFLDLSGDIVQVEFSGKGSLTISLDADTYKAPAESTTYNQPGVEYVQGLASFTITGSDATTNFSVWTVGTATAHGGAASSLFATGLTGGDHDADVQRLTIVADPANANGSLFGGIRMGNATFGGASGVVGISAANVAVQDVVRIGDISSSGSATPTLIFGTNSQFGAVDVQGGDLLTSKAINNTGSYAFGVNLVSGGASDGTALPAATSSASISFTDKNPFASAAGKSYTLSAGVDTVTGTAGDDTFVGNNTANSALYLTALDKLDGGAGDDKLSVILTAAINTTTATGTTITGIETVELQSTSTVTADTSAWTGVTTLNSVSVGGATLTASGTTAVTSTDSAQAAGALSITGGAAVTATAVGQTTGGITVSGAKGAVTVSASGDYTDGADITLGAIAVTGGTSVNVSQSTGITSAENEAAKADPTNFTLTQSAVTVTGTSTTTDVTVTQAKAVGEVDSGGSDGKIGIINGAVNVLDANRTSTSAAGTITSVSLNSYGASTINSSALTTVNLTGTGGTLSIERGNLSATPTANTLTLNVNGLSGGAITDAEAASDDGFTTVKVVASGASSTIADLNFADATALEISGDKAVTFTANTGIGNVTSITSTNTAGVTLGTQLGTGVTFTGGEGADSITLGATKKAIATGGGTDSVTVSVSALGSGGSIDAGEGTDTLVMGDSVAVTASAGADFENTITGFERLSVTGATAADQEIKLNNLDDINYVSVAGVNGGNTLTLSSANSGFTLVANSGTSGTVAVSLANATSSDSINVNVSANNAARTMAGLNVAGFETLNFNTDNSSTSSSPSAISHVVTTLTSPDTTKIVVAGDAGLTITNATSATKLATFDASGVTKGAVSITTGALTVEATLTGGADADTLNAAASTKVVTINGGAGADTITGSSTKASTLNGGDGADTITGGSVADVIDGGAGSDTFVADLTEQAGASTTDGAIVNLSASALTQSAVFTATGKFLSAASPTLAAGSASYLFSGESSTDAVVVDTLSNIENVTGTSGADYIVGSDGDNVIEGGAGVDTLVGGSGADSFVIGQTTNANREVIKDFTVGDGDKLVFDISSLGLNAADYASGAVTFVTVAQANALGAGAASNHVIVDTAANLATFADAGNAFSGAVVAIATDTGNVIYDADGDLTAGSVIVATTSGTALASATASNASIRP